MTYASLVGLTRNGAYRNNQNQIRYGSRRLLIGPISNFIILLVLTCLLVIFYLAQVTKTNNYGYVLDEYVDSSNQFKQDYQELLIEESKLRSVTRFQGSQLNNDYQLPGIINFQE